MVLSMSSPSYKLATHAWYMNSVAWWARTLSSTLWCTSHCYSNSGCMSVLQPLASCICNPWIISWDSCPWPWQHLWSLGIHYQNWPCTVYLNILWIQQYITFQLSYNRKICNFIGSLTYMVISPAMTGPCTVHHCCLLIVFRLLAF